MSEAKTLTRDQFNDLILACSQKHGQLTTSRHYSSSLYYKFDQENIVPFFSAVIQNAKSMGVPKEYFGNLTTKEALANAVWAPEACTQKHKRESRDRGIKSFIRTITVLVQDIYNTDETLKETVVPQSSSEVKEFDPETMGNYAKPVSKEWLDKQEASKDILDPEMAKLLGLADE